MRHFFAMTLAAALASQSHPFPPKASAEQRADYERGQTSQFKFEQDLFAEAGFKPLDAIAAEKRTVRRVLFQNPYMMLPVPGIQIEQKSSGLITLKVIGRGLDSAPATLPSSAWARLSDLQGTLFERKPYVPWDPPKPDAVLPAPPPICHGWIVRFGMADKAGMGSASWAQCGGKDGPAKEYAAEMARLAVSTRADCKFDEANPFFSFSACFTPHPRS